ncbi:hypothetical protein LOK74_01940 [Brevibacillus humidisoli]|uniref:hypothetical protein n=1 Tax=Brevibacillus humidisoli TaxID=2895522 RepID=UPI001E42BAA3|nr:hypothetical protein [Brevibacillus humidisoli]UFJ41321.1 hypothetical protein LOK74_01940 [Brevibacillus humidisoli]
MIAVAFAGLSGILFCLNLQLQVVVGTWFAALIIPVSGVAVRRLILWKARKYSNQIGLQRMFLLRLKETKTEIWWEVHVREPYKPISPTRLLRQYIRDHQILYQLALQQKKRAKYIGTTHTALWRLTFKAVADLDVQIKKVESLADPYVPKAEKEWLRVFHKWYGTAEFRIPRNWETWVIEIRKEGVKNDSIIPTTRGRAGSDFSPAPRQGDFIDD